MSSPFDLIKALQSLASCRDLDSIVTILGDAARDLTGADGATVILREDEQCYYAQENAIAPLWRGQRFPIGSCISGWCILRRQRVAVPDIYADPRVPHDPYKATFVKSLAMVPIRPEEPIGAIGAYWATHHQASEAELDLLQCLGDSASLAIANASLIASLEEASRRKDRFLAILGHDLRNSLAPLLCALHAIGLKPGDVDTAQRMREIMERQVQHMRRQLEGLLDYRAAPPAASFDAHLTQPREPQ
jgi:GAF domain-containing protein